MLVISDFLTKNAPIKLIFEELGLYEQNGILTNFLKFSFQCDVTNQKASKIGSKMVFKQSKNQSISGSGIVLNANGFSKETENVKHF